MVDKVYICGIDTSSLPKITKEESESLLKLAQGGDEKAKTKFTLANFRLVLSIVKRFPTTKVSKDDMFQSGLIGLVKAVNNFDFSFGVTFSTYAVPMIIGEIKKIIRTSNSLRVSRSIRDTAYEVLRVRNELEKNNCVASTDEIARELNLPESEVVYALDAISDPVSLYEPVYSKEGEELYLIDQIGDDRYSEERWSEHTSLKKAIETLCEREKAIIYMRYYEGKTQTEISKEIGLSQAQISRLEKTALKNLKKKII